MIENITIKVTKISYGNQDIEILFDGERLSCSASYIGSDPLGDLIRIAAAFTFDRTRDKYTTKWEEEPGIMEFSVRRDEVFYSNLHIEAKETGNFIDPETNLPWKQDVKYHFEVSLGTFREAVVKEALRVLKTYGLRGYGGSWCDGWDSFPVTTLLILLGDNSTFDEESEIYRSRIKDELQLLIKAVDGL